MDSEIIMQTVEIKGKGVTLHFPDEMSQDEIKSVIQKDFSKKKEEMPLWVKAIGFVTGASSEKNLDVPEVTRTGVNVPPSADVSFWNDPTTALAMGITGGARAAGGIASKLAIGAREGVGWLTGGATDIPKLAKGGVEAGVKAITEKNLAPRMEAIRAVGKDVPVLAVTGKPVVESIVEQTSKAAVKAAPKFAKEQYPITPKRKDLLGVIEGEISVGKAGYRGPDAETREWKGFPSTFPDYFKNKGYTKKETLSALKKAQEGAKLTDRQRTIVDDLYSGKRHDLLDEVLTYREQKRLDREEAINAITEEHGGTGTEIQSGLDEIYGNKQEVSGVAKEGGELTQRGYTEAEYEASLANNKFPWELGEGGFIGDKPSIPKTSPKTSPKLNDGIIKDITDLTKAIPTVKLHEPINPIEKGKEAIGVARDKIADTYTKVKASVENVWNRYLHPEPYTDWDTSIRSHIGTLQESSLNSHNFSKSILEKIPDKARREALVNYIQADGDIGLLNQRALDLEGKGIKTNKGYKLASNLTPEEMNFGRSVKQYFDSMLDKAIEADVLEHGVENYVPQLWDKSGTVGKRLIAEANSGLLKKDPFFAKKRIYDSYFEGEMLGEIPKNKDIGFLITAYDRAFNQAIATRSFVKSLSGGIASDGRPLAMVAGHASPFVEDADMFVKPTSHSNLKVKAGEETAKIDTHDYVRPPDNPAFRKWKWVSHVPSEEGIDSQILSEGDMYLHPEIAKKVKNVFTRSAIRENVVGKAALSTGATLKGTMLSLSGFHQTQVGLHAVFHGVNPFNAPKINLAEPLQKDLVQSGMVIFDYRGQNLFAEGLTSGGLVAKTPVIGKYLQQYTDYLFKDYIPRLKMAMGQAAFARNTERYGSKMDKGQILKLTADQSNAAFGELNYAVMARNQTFQDSLRLMMLAPDFLEARARFVGQALRPGGREQLMAAIVRGMGGMGTGSYLINKIINPDWTVQDSLHHPFSIMSGENEYTLRSIPGDIYHLATDPRSFIYYRLNPFTVKPLVEFATHRDAQGHWVDPTEQVKDYLNTMFPIPTQKAMAKVFKKQEEIDWWGGILQSVGINVYKHRTELEKSALDLSRRSTYYSDPDVRSHSMLVNVYAKQVRELLTSNGGKMSEINDKITPRINKDLRAGRLYPEELDAIIDKGTGDPLEKTLKGLTAEDLVKLWPKASAKERDAYSDLLNKKLENLEKTHPSRYEALVKKMTQ